MQHPPPQQTVSDPSILLKSSEFCETNMVEARLSLGVTSVGSPWSRFITASSSDASVIEVEAFESLV